MHSTPNGGLAVLPGKGFEFSALPCRHEADEERKCDRYYYDGVTLAIAWEGEEFFEV
jgi:hypothetical protein